MNRFLESTRIAEDVLGHPPTLMEIFVTLEATYGKTVNNIYEAVAVLFSLLREDLIYSDLLSFRYTCTKQEGFYTYSEIFRMKFPSGYICDDGGRVVPTTARTVNLQNLRSIMLSTDEALYRDNRWIWDGEFRFLDGESNSNNRIGFTSYPRSGNSFLRRYVEQVTGISTGSSISIHTSSSLQIMGLKGEGVVNDRIWVAKSHHPFNIKKSEMLPCNKTFICVRNPLDVFPSFASLCNTLSHGNKTEFEFDRDYPEYWDWFVRKQSDQFKKFFEILLRHCTKENRCPIYIVRYEDLVTAPKETLMGLMSYILEVKDLSGTNVERRIDEVVAKGSSAA